MEKMRKSRIAIARASKIKKSKQESKRPKKHIFWIWAQTE